MHNKIRLLYAREMSQITHFLCNSNPNKNQTNKKSLAYIFEITDMLLKTKGAFLSTEPFIALGGV